VRKLVTFAVLAFCAWLFITFTWATAAHLTGIPGPAKASAASLELAARAITMADPPGALGTPQRLAAGSLRNAADLAERLHRGPERAMARLLDRLGHRHSHSGHAFALAAPRAPMVIEFEDWDADWQEGWAEALRELRENKALLELRRHEWLQDGERTIHLRRRAIEHSRERVERSREQIERSRERIERRMADLEVRLERLGDSQQSEVSDRLKDRIRDMLRDLKRELEDLLEDADVTELIEISESSGEIHMEAPTIAIKVRHQER
jgi:hypothetical protein